MRENFLFVWEIVKDREAWHPVVHGVTKSWTRVSNWTTEFLSGNSIDQERMKCHIPKTERKNMPVKLSFTYEGKILSQTNKSWGVSLPFNTPWRNAERSSSSWNEKTLMRNMESIQRIGENKSTIRLQKL